MHDGSTWGAYQHYGDPNDLLMPKLKDTTQTAPASASKVASKAGTKKSVGKRGAGAKKSTSKAAGKKAPRKRAK
jgi:hypothetical protein